MVKQNRSQKLILGWILQICLAVLLSNPTGVSGIDFPSLSSFQGLRGAVKKDSVSDADNSLNEMFSEDLEDYSPEEDLPEDERNIERELHPGYYGRRYYGGGWNSGGYYRPTANTHYHYKRNYNSYYYGGGYYNGYYYNNKYYGGNYYKRRPYSWYNGGGYNWDDWVGAIYV